MRRLGASIQLIYWDVESVPEAVIPLPVASVVDVMCPIVRQSTIRSAAKMLFRADMKPWPVASRTIAAGEWMALLQQVKAFDPHVVLCESIWTTDVGQALAEEVECPWFVRSHNVEHIYMREQLRLAQGPRQSIALYLACMGLERFEERALGRASGFFDISMEDLSFWQGRGMTGGVWVPPLCDPELFIDCPRSKTAKRSPQVLYFGNLRTPNNVVGVQWLVNHVMPRVWADSPGVRLVIAGSDPDTRVERACAGRDRVELVINPSSLRPLIEDSTVLVNPAPWSSGVNLKSIDMLSTGLPVVSTFMGVRGLPDSATRLFRVADTPETFSGEILASMTQSWNAGDRGEIIRHGFGDDQIKKMLNIMQGHA
jgi:hypothetical protein